MLYRCLEDNRAYANKLRHCGVDAQTYDGWLTYVRMEARFRGWDGKGEGPGGDPGPWPVPQMRETMKALGWTKWRVEAALAELVRRGVVLLVEEAVR